MFLKNGNDALDLVECDTQRYTVHELNRFFFFCCCLFGDPFQNKVFDRKSDILRLLLLFILCGDILLDKDRALWWRQRAGEKRKKKKTSYREEGKKSLSTCSKTQCIVLKTEKGGIFLKWAKSRLQGVLRQRDERSSRERRKWGLRRRHLENCLLLTGSQPGTTPEKLAKHRRVCFREGRGVVEVGCSCRQLFRTTSSTCTEQRRLSEAPEDRCQWNPNKRHKRL